MGGIHVLDDVIGDSWPIFATEDDVKTFEATPYQDRIKARSTYEALKIGASVNPDQPAIQFLPNANAGEEPVEMTHGRFIELVTQVANALHELGIGKDDVVSLLLPLIPQSFYALLGAQAAGIANPINPFLEPDQIAHILRAAKTKVLIAMGPSEGFDTWDKIGKIRDQLPDLKAILVFEPWGAAPKGTVSFNMAVRAQPGDRLISGREIASDDIAAYFHTGGTTGTPQLVPLTHGNLVYQAWGMAMMFRSRPGVPLFMALPLFHVGGALTHCLQQLSVGGTLVVLSSGGWRNKNAMPNIWKLVERFRPEVFAAVPTVIGAVLNTPFDGADVSSIKTVTGGGSAIPVAVAEAYKNRFNLEILETYGMTEVSSCHTISYRDRPIYLGSVGRALPYSDVRVVELDANGKVARDCAPGEIGVVAMSGPGVFQGYATGSPDAPFVAPGWVNSGDLGRLDSNGYLWITGRTKDLIIRGGHNIDPRGIEEILYDHPAVQDAALVGEPDGYAGELPVAYVQLKLGKSADTEELKAWTAARTPERAALPVHIYLVDDIPLTAVGKVFKPDLRYDAAMRALTRMIEPIAETFACTATVKVGAHPSHGTFATITLIGAAAQEVDVMKAVAEKLEPLTLRYELKWHIKEPQGD